MKLVSSRHAALAAFVEYVARVVKTRPDLSVRLSSTGGFVLSRNNVNIVVRLTDFDFVDGELFASEVLAKLFDDITRPPSHNGPRK